MRPVKEAFERLGQASRILKAREQTGTLTVSTMPSFAAKWLVPRLGSFREQHPDIDVRIAASERLVDFNREDVDVAIRFGSGHLAGPAFVSAAEGVFFSRLQPETAEGTDPVARAGRSHQSQSALRL